MYYSFEGKIEKDICVIMEDYPDGSFSILGITEDKAFANTICHMLSCTYKNKKFSFTTIDLIGLVNDLLTGQYL